MYREDDIALWKKWKKDKSQQNASLLVNQLIPLVKNDISRYSNNIPFAVVEAHAKELLLQACENYDPKKGVELATFAKSYMLKLNQLNEGWRSPIKIPAHRASKFGLFKNTYETLVHNLGREPNVQEISDHIKWPQAEVARFLKEIRSEFTDDRPFVSDYKIKKPLEEEMIDYIYHDLSPDEKLLFEYTTGYNGRPEMNNTELMKKLKMTQNQLSYEKKKLVDKIEGMLHE